MTCRMSGYEREKKGVMMRLRWRRNEIKTMSDTTVRPLAVRLSSIVRFLSCSLFVSLSSCSLCLSLTRSCCLVPLSSFALVLLFLCCCCLCLCVCSLFTAASSRLSLLLRSSIQCPLHSSSMKWSLHAVPSLVPPLSLVHRVAS